MPALADEQPAPGIGSAHAARRIDGIALSPHYENPAEGLRFDLMVDEVAATGANHLSIVVQWSQTDIRASAIAPHPKETQPDEVIRRLIRRARGRGLKVLVFPILWVEQRAIGEWRGTLAPADLEAWWVEYQRFILHYAALAAEEQAELFCVGSELSSMERHEARWRKLIAAVRAKYPGRLVYSANWDHYEGVTYWDALDLAGVTGYFKLSERSDPSLAELTAAWQEVRRALMEWRRRIGRPLIITEVGYPSISGAAASPWDYTGDRPVDLTVQRRALAAFATVWADELDLAGVFFWNWWGKGGPDDRWYTLRGKPAEGVVRRWFLARPRNLDTPPPIR